MQFDWFLSVLEQKWLENHEIYYIHRSCWVSLEISTLRTSPRMEVALVLAILCDVSWIFPKFLTPSLFFPEVWWRHLWMTLRRETCLDKKILTGLLKGQNMTMHYQLYLSMVWDRVDIAEEKIFVHGSECLGKQSSIRWVVENLTLGVQN